MPIKNVVFDVGNVLFRWDPLSIVINTFADTPNPELLAKSIFKHQTWLDLNLGRINEQQAIAEYQARLVHHADQFPRMMENVRASLSPIEESIALLRQLQRDYQLYALTDNTHEIMAHLKQQHDFWEVFQGIVVSAEVGHLKPSEAIYRHLLRTHNILAQETVFIDDLLQNIIGARNMGMKGVQFKDIEQCLAELKQLGVKIR